MFTKKNCRFSNIEGNKHKMCKKVIKAVAAVPKYVSFQSYIFVTDLNNNSFSKAFALKSASKQSYNITSEELQSDKIKILLK